MGDGGRTETSADMDPAVQPGGDLHGYLRDLKSSARYVSLNTKFNVCIYLTGCLVSLGMF